MKGAYRLSQSRKLSPVLQKLHLSSYTDGKCLELTDITLRWHYSTRPLALGREYEILINYMRGFHPDIYVTYPNLKQLTSDNIPHIYNTKDPQFPDATCLCLYMSKYGEWHEGKIIAKTIVGWADLWLLYFEYWLATGVWEGGGEHPSPSN